MLYAESVGKERFLVVLVLFTVRSEQALVACRDTVNVKSKKGKCIC